MQSRDTSKPSSQGDSGHGSGTGASKLVRRLLRRLAPVCKEMRYLVFTFGLPALGEELMLASKNGFKLEEVYDVCGDRTDIWDETLRSDLCLPIQQPDLEVSFPSITPVRQKAHHYGISSTLHALTDGMGLLLNRRRPGSLDWSSAAEVRWCWTCGGCWVTASQSSFQQLWHWQCSTKSTSILSLSNAGNM